MKILFGILSVYILAVSCLPCTDLGNCKSESMAEHSHYTISDQTNHQHDSENCPPFCTCSCCGQNFNAQQIAFILPLNTLENSNFYLKYSSPFLSETYTKIWQPPKLS